MKRLRFGKIALAVALFCTTHVLALHAQTFSTLVEFNGTNGAYPYLGSLIQGTDGNLYGTTSSGGTGIGIACPIFGCGTIFKITPRGRISLVYKFCSKTNCTDGGGPAAGLVLGANGSFYGTTQGGGAYAAGTVFEITSSGVLTTLYSFCPEAGVCPDGAIPRGGLVQAANGNFYGTTFGGGAYADGTVFEITQGGKLMTLYSFCPGGDPCSDGNGPWAGLIQGTDGSLYGTTAYGGSHEDGTVFKITQAGRLTTLHSFCSVKNCADGQYPYSGLTQGTDGNFYGTTNQGGITWGTVFRITPGGALTTLYDFSSCTNSGCPDGASPMAGLVQSSDGNFYGTTQTGGTEYSLCGGILGIGCGLAFRITPDGDPTVLYDFCSQSGCTDGFSPEGGLFQATDGIFYGAAMLGGNTTGDCAPDGCGTVYSISSDLTPFVKANPNFGKVGRVIGILGNNLSTTSSVTFNGTPATFEVISGTYIKAEVPTAATTGLIQVKTSSGMLSSNAAFLVIP